MHRSKMQYLVYLMLTCSAVYRCRVIISISQSTSFLLAGVNYIVEEILLEIGFY